MRRSYSRPVFYAEAYVVSDSIAACDYKIEETTVLTINKGDNMCSNGSDGHVYGGQNGKKGSIINNGGEEVITLFNDGAESSGCQYDWGGRLNNVVYGYNNTGTYISMGTFADAFYGNEATEANHAPGYLGKAFFS